MHLYARFDFIWTHWLIGALFDRMSEFVPGDKQWFFEINIGPLSIAFSNLPMLD